MLASVVAELQVLAAVWVQLAEAVGGGMCVANPIRHSTRPECR